MGTLFPTGVGLPVLATGITNLTFPSGVEKSDEGSAQTDVTVVVVVFCVDDVVSGSTVVV